MGEEESTEVQTWLSRVSPSTATNYQSWWNAWSKWLRVNGGEFKDMTPAELLKYQKNCSNGERYKILDVAQRYILSLQGRRASTKRNYYRMVRSFFSHNRAELPRDKNFKIKSEVPRVRGRLSIENVRDIALRSNSLYRAAILCMFQGALGLSEIEYWSKHGLADLKSQLKKNREIIKIHLPGRKRNRNEKPYITYIGGDAVDALKKYMTRRPNIGDDIFINQTGKPLKRITFWHYWRRNLESMGLIEKELVKKMKMVDGEEVEVEEGVTSSRYGYNPHEMRDLFRSQWEKSGASGSVAEYSMGHVVDALGYNKAAEDEAWAEGQYRKAEPWLNIISDPSTPYGYITDVDAVDKIRGQSSEITEMKHQMQTLQDQLQYMMQSSGGTGRVSPDEAHALALTEKYERPPDPELAEAERRDFNRWRAQRDKARKEATQ